MKQCKEIIFSMFILLSTGLYANTVNMAPIITYLLSNTATALTFENNTPVSIIDNGTGGAATTSEINVTGATTSIKKITITLDITHSWISDLDIRLISPSGTSIILSDVNIPYAINYENTTFDDDAVMSITNEDGNISGTYSPVEPLAEFIEEDPNGTWILEVHDTVLTFGGTLNSWSLTFLLSDTVAKTPQEIAIDKIKTYADDQANPVPTIQDYINAGVTGVTEENIDEVNSIVASLVGTEVDTVVKIQAVVDDVNEVSFADDVMPIFVSNCQSCHPATGGNRTFRVSGASFTYDNIINNTLIDTIDPDASLILLKGNAEVSHNGGNVLSDTESAMIRNWIEQGGLNN